MLHAEFEASHLCCIVIEFCFGGDLHPLRHKQIVGDREGCSVEVVCLLRKLWKGKEKLFQKKYCIENLLDFFFFWGLDMCKFLLYICILEVIFKISFPFFSFQFGKEKIIFFSLIYNFFN